MTKPASISNITSLKLAKNVYAAIPHTLYATKSATYPQVDTLSLTAFKNKIKDYWLKKPKEYSEEARVANVVIIVSVLKFAFPYWDDTNTNPEKLFSFLSWLLTMFQRKQLRAIYPLLFQQNLHLL